MRNESDNSETISTQERVYALSDQMLALSVAERRRRWKTYLAHVTILSKESERSDLAPSEGEHQAETRDEPAATRSQDTQGQDGSDVERERWKRARHYRARSEEARREARTAAIETRDDFMLVARAWKALADAFEASLATKTRVERRDRNDSPSSSRNRRRQSSPSVMRAR